MMDASQKLPRNLALFSIRSHSNYIMSEAGVPRPESDINRTYTDPPAVVGNGAYDFEAFRGELRDALCHLHDPEYHPSHALCEVLGCEPAQGPVQSAIIRAIDALRPEASVPVGSQAERNFASLEKRFVLGLSQEETAERLHMSVRHVQRIQARAIHALARAIWERSQAEDGPAHPPALEERTHPVGSSEEIPVAPDWRSQAEAELASLRMSQPDATADVGETIRGVLELERALTSRRGIRLEEGFIQPGLVTTRFTPRRCARC